MSGGKAKLDPFDLKSPYSLGPQGNGSDADCTRKANYVRGANDVRTKGRGLTTSGSGNSLVRWLVLSIGLILMSTPLLVQPVEASDAPNLTLESLFYRANDQYDKYSYKDALQTYQSILDFGYASGPVYYNLGNTYYRLNEKGLALVNYLRAQSYIPRDPDLRSNLEHLRQELELTEKQAGSGLQGVADWLGRYLTVRELVAWSSVIMTLLVVLVLLRMYQPKLRDLFKVPVVVIGLALVVSLLATGIGGYYRYYTNPGIVITEEAVARFEPADSGEAHFTLELGDRVEVGSRRHEWVSVERSDGKKGWVKVEEVESLRYDSGLAKGKY